MTTEISKTMTIGELIQQHPHCAEILLDEGVHCVGCGAAYWETIEEGLLGHGKTEEQVNQIIKTLQESVELMGAPQETEGIKITASVVRKIQRIKQDKEKPTHGLRIAVVKGGCSGMQYEFSLEEHKKEEDHVIDKEGVQFFLDKETFKVLQGATIDYVEGLASSGFKISNPNAKSTCGCGQSFS